MKKETRDPVCPVCKNIKKNKGFTELTFVVRDMQIIGGNYNPNAVVKMADHNLSFLRCNKCGILFDPDVKN